MCDARERNIMLIQERNIGELMTSQSFDENRATRYVRALNALPSARIRELIPILLLLYRENLSQCTLVDLASGNGYLSTLLESTVRRLIRVDASSTMLAHSYYGDAVVADIRNARSKLVSRGIDSVDIITCLAALHHIYEPGQGGNPVS